MNNNDSGAGWALLGLGLLPFFVVFLVWLISASVTAAIAYHRGRSTWGFFFVTFFFLGPLGPGFALLAQREVDGAPVVATVSNRVIPMEGRTRFLCSRCGAENDELAATTAFNCWRCSERHTVKRAATASAI